MALSNPFVWGRGGAQLTPDQIAKQREIEDALLQRGVDTSPVGDWTQGLARVADAAAGSFRRGRLIRAEKESQAYNADKLKTITSLLGGTPSSSASIPSPGAVTELNNSAPVSDLTDNQIYNDFIGTVKEGGVTNPYGLAAVAATGRAESQFDPRNANRSWSDPSQSGQPGTAGGIMSWRGPRLQALYDFAAKNGEQPGAISPKTQGMFFLQEDPNLVTALNNAKSVDEAQQIMNRAWAFAGYDKPGGESARRLSYANSFLPAFQGQGGGTQVASLDPSAGMPQTAPQAIDAAAAPSGYVDPQVTTDFRNTPPAAGAETTVAPGSEVAAAPPLPPPTTVAAPPPVASVPPVQTAQAAPPIMAPNGAVIPPAIIEALSDPRLNEQTRGIAELLLRQQQARAQALYEDQLRRSDPSYQLGIAKTQVELDNLRNPKISPADQARIDLEKQKFDFDRNKPTEVNGRLVGPDGKVVYDAPMSATDEARMKLDRDKFDAEQKAGQWEKMTDGRLYNKNTGEFRDAPPPVPGSVPPKFDDVSGLRKEIQQLPSYKNLSQALPIYRSMTETAGRDSKASDLNLVYGLGKIMDPTSVVREGEMVMVKNTSSLPDWFQGAIASLNGGAALTPETRQAIMREAYGRVSGYDQAFKQDTSQYAGIVTRNQFNPADVIPDFGTYAPWKPAADPSAPAVDIPPAPAGVDPEDWKYLSPDQRRLWQK